MLYMKKAFVIVSIPFLFSCNNEPQLYLNSALDIIEKNSIKKEDIDWGDLRKTAVEKLKGKQSIEETYPIIENVLKELGDNHSFLLTQELSTKIQEGKQDAKQLGD